MAINTVMYIRTLQLIVCCIKGYCEGVIFSLACDFYENEIKSHLGMHLLCRNNFGNNRI